MSTEESPREIAILGAGKIGRGVVGLLFSRAGYRLHLYDMYMEGMRKLETQGYYDVRVTDGHDVDESTRIDDFDIVDSNVGTGDR
jgi:mannitol-1-phosphate 5-dehydrogenase